MPNLRAAYYSCICLDGLRNTAKKNITQHSGCTGQDSNPEAAEYEAIMLTNRLRRKSKCHNHLYKSVI
jgi:hypothetical protein